MEYINYKKIKVLLLFFLIIFQLNFLYAIGQNPPALPDNIYGQIFVDNSPADVNTKIIAKINDYLIKTYYTTEEGKFGSLDNLNFYFLVSAFTSDIGEEIEFYYFYDDFLIFSATTDPEVVYYDSGVLKEVNLYFYTEITDDGQDNGNGSNGYDPNGDSDIVDDNEPEDDDYTVEDVYDDIDGFVPLSPPIYNNDDDENDDDENDDDENDDDENDDAETQEQPFIPPTVPDTNQVPDINQSDEPILDTNQTQEINQEKKEFIEKNDKINYFKLGIISIFVFIFIFIIGLLIFKINKKKKEKYVQTKLF